MYTTTIIHFNSKEHDKAVEIKHDFGNQVTVVTNLENRTTRIMHGQITMSEHEMISDTAKYLTFLNNIDNETNPQK